MMIVKLKNGAEEPRVLVAATMMSLESLLSRDPDSFRELVMKARNRHHTLGDYIQATLERENLVDASGNIHSSVRNVILSAVIGEGIGTTLGKPVT